MSKTFILADNGFAVSKYQITKIFWMPKSMDPEDKDLYGVLAEVANGEQIIIKRDTSREEAIKEIQRIAEEM